MITQNTLILNHMLRTGSITQREAMIDYSIQCLTKRISELRSRGYKIKSEKKQHPTTNQRYVRYVLVSKKGAK